MISLVGAAVAVAALMSVLVLGAHARLGHGRKGVFGGSAGAGQQARALCVCCVLHQACGIRREEKSRNATCNPI